MTPKIFVTGITGYIAGDAVYALHQAHPHYEYSFLVRSQDKADTVKRHYPSSRIVIGGLDDSELLEAEAARADIVLHAADASDHEGAARAIAAGLLKGHSPERPGYWLHVSGTGILTFQDSANDYRTLGSWSEKQFNDLSGVKELTSLPDEAFHRNVDIIVLDAGTKHADTIKTAILCPPTIYGHGRGPVSGRSRQVYELAKLVLQKHIIPIVGQGKARWNSVHVADLSQLFRLLVEKAAGHDTSPELWGPNGYMLAENGEFVWTELARVIGQEASKQGYVKDIKEDALSKDEALKVAGFDAVSWGLNSRGKAERARKYLGWAPSEDSIQAEVPKIVKSEYELLGRK